MYKENDLLQIAKRENNNKRNYLVINKLQGKHIPVEPSQALGMFKELAMLLKKHIQMKKYYLLVLQKQPQPLVQQYLHILMLFIYRPQEKIYQVQIICFFQKNTAMQQNKD